MSRLGDNCDQKHKAYIDARSTAKDAQAIVCSVAVDVAEQVLKNGTAETTILDLYEKAKELAGKKADLAKEAWEAYIQAYRIMTGQETEMPPAVAAAASERTRIRLVEVRVDYLQDGEIGAASVPGDDYETARDQGFDLVPDGAERLSIIVDRT